MKVIAVDDEQISLDDMKMRLDKMAEIECVTAFSSPRQAVNWLKVNPVDAAFLDIRMRSMDGLTLAKQLKEFHPSCAVIFVSAYTEYAVHAYRMHASGYLVKPVTDEDIRQELYYILHPPVPPITAKKTVRVQCFGNFEVFINEELAKFRYSKTKELLAYLVDRKGAAIETGELCAVLWEDKPYSQSLRSQLRNSVADLIHCLSDAGAETMIRKKRNSLAVDTSAFDCDFYSFLQIEPGAVNAYKGEYMTQYSWAEMTLGNLERMQEKLGGRT